MEKNAEESPLALLAESESDFRDAAGTVAGVWRAQPFSVLVVGLTGPLGAGKTTWVRGMLRALGHRGRVPSPTYTILEHYELDGLTVVHLDLYRLSEDEGGVAADEFEALGVRDWLGRDRTWLLVEWPERSPQLMRRCDVGIELEFRGAAKRAVTLTSRTPAGEVVLRGLRSSPSLDSSFDS